MGMDNNQVNESWTSGIAYEQFVGRWSRRVAPVFLSWLGIPKERRWLDVGCGTGELCAAILEHCSPVSVAGVEPSDEFLRTAKEILADRATLYQGSATAIPLDDSSVDVVVSGLVLNFVSDQRAALAEMVRVTDRGGTIGAYVWDYAGKMELLRFFWDAAVELSPDAANLDGGSRFPLCRPEALVELFASAALNEPEVMPIDIPTPFVSFEDYWQPFLGGVGTAGTYAMSLDETKRVHLRDLIRAQIPIQADGSILLTARAWAARATVTK